LFLAAESSLAHEVFEITLIWRNDQQNLRKIAVGFSVKFGLHSWRWGSRLWRPL